MRNQKIPPRDSNKNELHFLAKVRSYFFSGLLVTAPVALTFYIIWLIVKFLDDAVKAFIPNSYQLELYIPFRIPGLGLILGIVVLIGIGAIATGFLGRMIVHFGDRILHKTPFVRGIYAAIKQIFHALLEKDSKSLKEVVLVEYPRKDVWTLGFVTGETKGEIKKNLKSAKMLSIFVPTTPNPTAGFLLFVSEKEVKKLSLTVEEGIKMVVSLGIIGEHRIERP